MGVLKKLLRFQNSLLPEILRKGNSNSALENLAKPFTQDSKMRGNVVQSLDVVEIVDDPRSYQCGVDEHGFFLPVGIWCF